MIARYRNSNQAVFSQIKIDKMRLQNTVGRQADEMRKELDKKRRAMDQLKADSLRETERSR